MTSQRFFSTFTMYSIFYWLFSEAALSRQKSAIFKQTVNLSGVLIQNDGEQSSLPNS